LEDRPSWSTPAFVVSTEARSAETPGKIPETAWLPDVARRKVRVDAEVEIALLDWGGDGPLALLHHANGFCAGVWGLVAASLCRRYRVIAMDARGHGDSSRPSGAQVYHWDRFAEDLVAVAEQLVEESGRGSVALGLGHSFGGTSLLGAAARRPNLFEHLVLVDPVTPPPAVSSDPERPQRVNRLAEGARRRQQVFGSREEARERWAGRSSFARFDPRALDLYAVHGLRERSEGGFELKCAGEVEAAVFDAGYVDIFAQAVRVDAPTLFLWAQEGDFPRSVYQTLAASMPSAVVEDVEAGHLVPMERPDLVVAAVDRFAPSPD
jgi:pimeloyl-ACP methyl ester carboxylesterase